MCVLYIFTDNCPCGKELWRDTRDVPCAKAEGVMGACGSTDEVHSMTAVECSECEEKRKKKEDDDEDEDEDDK
ncbi:hypothetical protein NW768_004865 [Fusarium equiseti]|uniref:Uncharacterized protein n=1 Tax=Fusarium equiseti TaxID=61235 RepID=A0ABQ8RHH9_FUSEQ|nr:hypothetical protein NW768_004865 [Fusarium equiseti]